MTFFKGYLYDNTCTIYLFLSHECYHVPVKLRELNGLLFTFALSGQLKAQKLQLLKHTLWDTLHIKWLSTTLNMNGNRIDLPENVNIPLWDKSQSKIHYGPQICKIQYNDKTRKYMVCP